MFLWNHYRKHQRSNSKIPLRPPLLCWNFFHNWPLTPQPGEMGSFPHHSPREYGIPSMVPPHHATFQPPNINPMLGQIPRQPEHRFQQPNTMNSSPQTSTPMMNTTHAFHQSAGAQLFGTNMSPGHKGDLRLWLKVFHKQCLEVMYNIPIPHGVPNMGRICYQIFILNLQIWCSIQRMPIVLDFIIMIILIVGVNNQIWSLHKQSTCTRNLVAISCRHAGHGSWSGPPPTRTSPIQKGGSGSPQRRTQRYSPRHKLDKHYKPSYPKLPSALPLYSGKQPRSDWIIRQQQETAIQLYRPSARTRRSVSNEKPTRRSKRQSWPQSYSSNHRPTTTTTTKYGPIQLYRPQDQRRSSNKIKHPASLRVSQSSQQRSKRIVRNNPSRQQDKHRGVSNSSSKKQGRPASSSSFGNKKHSPRRWEHRRRLSGKLTTAQRERRIVKYGIKRCEVYPTRWPYDKHVERSGSMDRKTPLKVFDPDRKTNPYANRIMKLYSAPRATTTTTNTTNTTNTAATKVTSLVPFDNTKTRKKKNTRTTMSTTQGGVNGGKPNHQDYDSLLLESQRKSIQSYKSGEASSLRNSQHSRLSSFLMGPKPPSQKRQTKIVFFCTEKTSPNHGL